MRYRRSDGKSLTLDSHTPAEWADVMRDRFLDLGCSARAAAGMTAPIRAAVEDTTVIHKVFVT